MIEYLAKQFFEGQPNSCSELYDILIHNAVRSKYATRGQCWLEQPLYKLPSVWSKYFGLADLIQGESDKSPGPCLGSTMVIGLLSSLICGVTGQLDMMLFYELLVYNVARMQSHTGCTYWAFLHRATAGLLSPGLPSHRATRNSCGTSGFTNWVMWQAVFTSTHPVAPSHEG